MCGIAGILNLRGDAPVTVERLGRMAGVMAHRGPDDEGFHVDGAFGMAMRRLSIIDLTTGQQPICNEDGSVWMVFNGEIYNFLELRSMLERKGHRFYTNTDGEVIVHLYEDHGENFVRHLCGMFAIAVWDGRQRKLVLARDRLGIKPLYYYASGDVLLFGSEAKAILQEEVRREIDLQALHDYLSLNYVPGPRSIFQDVRKLAPGHVMTCCRGRLTTTPYWEPRYPSSPNGVDEEGYQAGLEELLKTVVKQHLISDVPLGVFLSGGLDSSTLVAMMREVGAPSIRTFSIGFEDPSYDELAYARTIAQRFETDHHELVVRPDAATLLPELVRHFDEPFADSSAIPVYCVSKLAARHVKVALSGEGGDEVFAGYETYAAYRVAEIYKRLPRMLASKLIPAAVGYLPVSHRRISFDYKAKRFVRGALLPPADAHYWWKVIFTEDAKAQLFGAGMEGRADALRLYREAYQECQSPEILPRLQHIDLKIYLPDDILVKADRMTMANSIEGRVPFADHRMVEFAASLPAALKVRGLTKKYILRRTMARYLPPPIVTGRKRGFNVPVAGWLAAELRGLVHDVLDERRVRQAGFFKSDVVARLIRDHEEKRADYSRNIWALLVFALWHDEYMAKLRAAA